MDTTKDQLALITAAAVDMKVIFDQLDMHKTRQLWPKDTPFQPALVKTRERSGAAEWVVLSEPLVPNQPPKWSLAEHDEYVRIPLFPYVVQSPQADRALAFALQLGLTCAGYLPAAVQTFHVVTGVPVQLLYDPDTDTDSGLRFWLGLAVILEKS